MQDIFAEDVRNRSILVLVHGFLGSSDMWGPQIKFFKDDFRVIATALPGFGNSSKMNSWDSIECTVKTILKYLKKDIKNFYLLGYSMGGMIVQEIARIAGEKILKLICYGTGPTGDIPGRFETIDQSRTELKIDGPNDTAYRIAKTWFIEQEKAKYFYLCEEARRQTSIGAADNGLVAMKHWDGVKNLQNIKNETLIIQRDQDKDYNFNQIKTLNDNISNNDLKVFKVCSHNVLLEKLDEFNMIVKKFLKKKEWYWLKHLTKKLKN